MKFGRKDYDERIIDRSGLIPDDEPVFFLRGRDKLAPKLLLMWASDFLLNGGSPLVAESAIRHANKMLEYQRVNGAKLAGDTTNNPFTSERLEAINGVIENLDGLCDKELSLITKQSNIDPNYMEYVNILLKLVPDSDENLMLLNEMALKDSAYDKSIKDLTIYDFNLDEHVLEKSYRVRYILYLNRLMNIVHLIKK